MPTDAALALRSHAEAMHSTAASMERIARGFGSGVRGAVQISASEVVGVEVLPPILAALQHAHPQLELKLVLSNRLQDFSAAKWISPCAWRRRSRTCCWATRT